MKLVLFDCDGTLVDSQHAIVAAMTDAFVAHQLEVPPRTSVLSVVGLSLDLAVEELLPRGTEPVLVERVAETYKASFGDRRRRAEVAEPLYPGIRDAIESFRGRDGIALGVATGKSRRGLKAVLEREGLERYFVTLQTADTHPSKPHPSMILAAIEEAGASPEDTVMIGDTTFDIEMALSAGAKAIGVTWGYHPEEALRRAGAHAISRSSDEMSEAVERLLFGGSHSP